MDFNHFDMHSQALFKILKTPIKTASFLEDTKADEYFLMALINIEGYDISDEQS